MKKIAFLIIVSILFALVLENTVSASEVKENDKKIMYESWLEQKIENATDVAEKKEAKATFKQYKELSLEDQNKFIEYMFDPKIQEEIATKLLYIPEGTTQTLQNGEIQLTASNPNITTEATYSNITDGIAPAGDQSKKATHNRGIKFLGVKIFQSTIWVKYIHNGTKVKEATSCNAFTSINYNPFVDSTYSTCVKGINTTKTRAEATADVSYSFIWDGLGMVYGSGELSVWGDINNKSGGDYVPY